MRFHRRQLEIAVPQFEEVYKRNQQVSFRWEIFYC